MHIRFLGESAANASYNFERLQKSAPANTKELILKGNNVLDGAAFLRTAARIARRRAAEFFSYKWNLDAANDVYAPNEISRTGQGAPLTGAHSDKANDPDWIETPKSFSAFFDALAEDILEADDDF